MKSRKGVSTRMKLAGEVKEVRNRSKKNESAIKSD